MSKEARFVRHNVVVQHVSRTGTHRFRVQRLKVALVYRGQKDFGTH